MKLVVLVFTIMLSSFGIKFIEKKREMELVIFDMYSNNFEDYLVFNEKIEVSLDKQLMGDYLKGKGYNVEFKEGDFEFIVSFRMIIKFEQKYSFCLEKNNEFE